MAPVSFKDKLKNHLKREWTINNATFYCVLASMLITGLVLRWADRHHVPEWILALGFYGFYFIIAMTWGFIAMRRDRRHHREEMRSIAAAERQFQLDSVADIYARERYEKAKARQ